MAGRARRQITAMPAARVIALYFGRLRRDRVEIARFCRRPTYHFYSDKAR